jgi:hypothetical protein
MKRRIIIWGHKLHSHTHSYVHAAFAKAFAALNYEVYWFDNTDNISELNFDNCIFLTEGQVDQNIPISSSNKYILHNCSDTKYNNLNVLHLQVYSNGKENSLGVKGQKIDECVYYDNIKRCLYQPWATDLLPNEIGDDYYTADNKTAVWVGTIGGGYHGNDTELYPFIQTLKFNNYKFNAYYPGQSSFEDNKLLIQTNELAPSIVGRWQKINGYVPCRIFKNISYGKLGITNSKTVFDLLDGQVLYTENSENLLDYYLSVPSNVKNQMFTKSLNLVKSKHTYINRIQTIFNFL